MSLGRLEPPTLPLSGRCEIVSPAFMPGSIALLNRDLRVSFYLIDRPDTHWSGWPRPTDSHYTPAWAGKKPRATAYDQ